MRACAGTGEDSDLVAGVRWPSPRFIASPDQTVIDNLTGLIWSKDSAPSGNDMTWQAALDSIKTLNSQHYLGYSDWRLPNIRELESLVDVNSHSPAMPPNHPFQEIAEGYWSSTTSVYEPSYAWVLYTLDGAVGVGYKAKADFYAWGVRSR